VATVITGVLFTPLVVVTAAAIAWRQMQIVESERGIVSRQQNKV
jgi:hypothetical protein